MSNGIQVNVNEDKKVAVAQMFIDDKYVSWVEFNLEQLTELEKQLKKAKTELKKLEPEVKP